MSICVIAYDTSNLKTYYSFDETNLTKMIDSVNGDNLTSTSYMNYASITGVNGKALRSGGLTNSTQYLATLSYNVDTSNKYSINVWIKNATTSSKPIFYLGNSSKTWSLNTQASNVLRYRNSSVNPDIDIILAHTIVNISSWNMLTLVYTGSACQLYVNTVAVNSTTCNNLWSNTNKLNLSGFGQYIEYDEMSIWNVSLNGGDMLTLYNNGLGQNYSNTILFNQSYINQTPICSGDYYFTSYYEYYPGYFEYYLTGDYGYCPDGCLNGSCITNSSCSLNTTLDYCDFIGQTRCAGSSQYQECQVTPGGCPKWSTPYTCATLTYCKEIVDANYFTQASCGSLNLTAGISSEPSFTVNPYNINGLGVYYTTNYVTRTNTINSKNVLVAQDFAISQLNTPSYITFNCDYIETLIVDENVDIILNDIYTYAYANTGTNIKLDINNSLLSNTGNVSNINITITDDLGTEYIKINYKRDLNAKTVCLTDLNSITELFCDVALVESLNNINSIFIIDLETNSYTVTSILNRTNSITYNTKPVVMPPIPSFSRVTFDIDGVTNSTVTDINIMQLPNFGGFRAVTYNDYGLYQCVYTSVGCRNVRTYLSVNATPIFNNFKDWKICVNSLDNQFATDSTDDSQGMSNGLKYFWSAIFIIVAIGVVGGSLGVITHHPGVAGISGMVAGIIVTIILATPTIAWLPLWLVILFIIIEAIAIVGIFKLTFLSTNQGV